MKTKLILNAAVRILFIGVLSLSVFPRLSAAQSDKVKLSFSMLTASHAAVGVPMTYQLVLTNTSATTTQIGANVKLLAPDGATFTLFTTTYTLTPGQVEVTSSAFQTSTFTNLTGAFTLRGFTTDVSSGDLLIKRDLPLSVVPVPANFVYASIGGQGPASARLGYTADYQTVVANLGTAPKELKTNTTLILVDGTQVPLTQGETQTFNPGVSITIGGEVTPSQYSTATGTYSVRVDVLDAANNILTADTFVFTRTALPSNLYPPSFTDTATQAGVNVSRLVEYFDGCGAGIPGYHDHLNGGGGVAVSDYDGDGFEDLYVVDMSGLGHLWHNNGDGTFADRATAAHIPFLFRQSGASFADFDNDGHPDLLLLPNEGQLMLLHNLGNGTFADITPASGLQTPFDQNFVSATWGDYDNDGFLDLYIVSHQDCQGMNTNDHLYHNNGDLTFTDVTNLLGGPTAPQVNGHGMVPVFVDYNNDGRIDLYVTNDIGQEFGPNVLWRNDGPGGPNGWIFTDVSAATHADVAISSMGIAIGDYNRNGVFNFFMSNTPAGCGNGCDLGDNILLQEQSDDTFVQTQGDGVGGAHVARPTIPNPNGSGLPIDMVTWNAVFYDFNNDGWEDLYVAGGPLPGRVVKSNALLLNNRDGTFLDLSLLSGTSAPNSGFEPGGAFADFNNDGFMDTFLEGAGEAGHQPTLPHLYMNNGRAQGNPNHWLEVKLIGTISNRDAIGAHLSAKVGGATLQRWVFNTGYQGNSTLIQHFGLGSATQVKTLTIKWPNGSTQTLRSIQADQKIVIMQQ